MVYSQLHKVWTQGGDREASLFKAIANDRNLMTKSDLQRKLDKEKKAEDLLVYTPKNSIPRRTRRATKIPRPPFTWERP